MPVMDNKRKADDLALVSSAKKSRNELVLSGGKDKALIPAVSNKNNL